MTSLLHTLHRAKQAADAAFDGNSPDVTTSQMLVLRAISEDDDQSQTDIVARTGIDRSTAAELIRRLVDRGLVARRRTRQDARRYALRLTDRGHDLMTASTQAAAATEAALLAVLTATERKAVLDSLAKIAAVTKERV